MRKQAEEQGPDCSQYDEVAAGAVFPMMSIFLSEVVFS
jgi:hypothetical protein